MFNAIQCFAKYNNRDIYAGLEGQHIDIFMIVNDDHLWWAWQFDGMFGQGQAGTCLTC